MRKLGLSRLAITALMASGGIVGVGGVLVTGAAPAWAGTQCPGPGPALCITPNSNLTNKQVVHVVVWTGTASAGPVVVTECNPAVANGDQAACNSNANDLNKPGGPKFADTNSKGKAAMYYTVRVSSTKDVGDGLCAPGDTCFLVAANPQTQQLVAGPTPFTTAGGSS